MKLIAIFFVIGFANAVEDKDLVTSGVSPPSGGEGGSFWERLFTLGTPVGVDAGASLLGAAIVSSALSGEVSKRRRRRDTSLAPEERERRDEAALAALQVVDSYFATIGAKDVDDCGKKLVCEIETIDSAKRTVEEMLISSLFETSKASIDPLSPKAEYDLAAFVGTNFDAKKCAERYEKCDLDRTVIGTALGKIAKKQKEQAPEKKKSKIQ